MGEEKLTMADNKQINLVLFFTWDVSLSLWKQKGLLEREVRLYQELARKGIKVTFLTWGDQQDSHIAQLYPEFDVFPLYTALPKSRSKALRALASLLAPWKARAKLWEADIIKTNQMWGGWCAVLAKWMFGKPLLVRTGYELYEFTVLQGHGYLRQTFVKIVSALTYNAADRIHLATASDRAFVTETFGCSDIDIKIMPNWIDTNFFKPNKVAEKPNSVLFVGRLTTQKNLEALVDAFAGTSLTLDIVGEGELKGALAQRAQRAGSNVNFLGYLPNNQLPKIYCQYPVYILPSHYEGNPKTLLEAMACGRPVIGTNAPGINSIIEHGKTGLLCNRDAQSIRKAINALLGDAELRKSLGERGRAWVEKNHNFEVLVEEEVAAYQLLAGAGLHSTGEI